MTAPRELHDALDALYAQVDSDETVVILGVVSAESETEAYVNRSLTVAGPEKGTLRTFLMPASAEAEVMGVIDKHVTNATPPDNPGL